MLTVFQPASRQSRRCARGDQDQDFLPLVWSAPAVATSSLMMVLQLAASNKWKATVGDLWKAFMQSDKPMRENGKLYAEQP